MVCVMRLMCGPRGIRTSLGLYQEPSGSRELRPSREGCRSGRDFFSGQNGQPVLARLRQQSDMCGGVIED